MVSTLSLSAPYQSIHAKANDISMSSIALGNGNEPATFTCICPCLKGKQRVNLGCLVEIRIPCHGKMHLVGFLASKR